MQAQSLPHAGQQPPPDRPPRIADAFAIAALALTAVAVLLDAAWTADLLPGRTPTVTYILIGVAVGGALIGVLLRVLLSKRSGRPRITLLEFAALGLLLGAWLLRGHPEIPPDPPLVAAAFLALMLLALTAWLRARSRTTRPGVP
jgi:peptidoglycan/LPS O-acetylase OafA/YrhL